MKSKTNKKAIVFLVIFTILLVGVLIIGFFSTTISKKSTEANTIEFMTTVNLVERIEEKGYYLIHVDEYVDLIVWTELLINKERLDSLKNGDIIHFRIEKVFENAFYDHRVDRIGICALRINGEDIITLESYNKEQDRDIYNIKIMVIVFGVIFLLVDIYCILLLKGINVFKKKRKNEDKPRTKEDEQ